LTQALFDEKYTSDGVFQLNESFQAGETFITIAQHHSKLGNKHDAATNFVDASNCYKKSDPKGTLFWPSDDAHGYNKFQLIFARGSCKFDKSCWNLHRHGQIYNSCQTSPGKL